MILKPKIGVLFITSGWFRDVGLQSASEPLTVEIGKIADEIIDKLSGFITPVHSGVVYTKTEAEAAAERMISGKVNGLIIAPLMWCEDNIIDAALKILGKIPVIVCTFLPYRTLPEHLTFDDMLKGSGSVCVLQISGMLKRLGYEYSSATGYYLDKGVYGEIEDYCIALNTKRLLANTRCGVLPFRCDSMTTTYVDEFVLKRDYGIELVYIELSKIKKLSESVTGEEIRLFMVEMESNGYKIEVDARNIEEGIRYSLAIEKAAAEYNLDILAMNDIIDEMHSVLGLRPCLTNNRLSKSGFVVSMESDIAAGIAMRILSISTGESPFYSEVFTVDMENNALLMGHAGYHDTVNHNENYPVRVIPDAEYKNSDRFTGACVFFKLKPGPSTAVNCVYDGNRLRMMAFEGESLPGPPKMDGNAHAFIKPDIKVSDFYKKAIDTGVSQHWIIIPGRHIRRLKEVCFRAGLDFVGFDE